MTKHTDSTFWRSTLCLWPSASTSTKIRGLVSILTRPTSTDLDRPCPSTTITWLPVCNSDKYAVLPSAIPTYACTGPCIHIPNFSLLKIYCTTTIVSACHKLQHCKIAKNSPPNKSLIRGMSEPIATSTPAIGSLLWCSCTDETPQSWQSGYILATR